MMHDSATAECRSRVVLRDATTGRWLHFAQPIRLVTAARIDEVVPALQSVEDAVETDGLHAAGFLAYEAAPAFDPALRTRPDGRFPLLWFGLYGEPEESERLPTVANEFRPPSCAWRPSITHAEYRKGFESIREFIRSGDTYQVNFTYRMLGVACSEPWSLFLHLVDAQEPTCGAFVDTGEWVICSGSPELFFRLDGGQIESRPMKGTAPRGLWFADDRRKARRLRASPKDRAENVMIVDMVRNDLGRIAEVGSVSVPALFAVQQYPTLWQMVSTVCARTQAQLPRIFQALFPPASITGAPKRRTMEIIAELESSPRRIYTGAVGFAAPGRRAQFNVAIRTVLVNTRRREAEYGVGGGIVWDSRCGREARECRLKTRILSVTTPHFDLLETLLWEPGMGYSLLGRHLTRLARSAAYFGFSADRRRIRQELDRVASRLPMVPHRVRLLVSRAGAARVEASPFAAHVPACAVIVPAQFAVDATDRFLYHKTTNRGVYEDALKARPGFSDVILFNRQGEVTESTIANVVVDIDGRLCTPPVRCGLLPGTQRAFLLGRKVVRERAIRLEELLRSPSVYLVNSLRGMWKVTVLQPEEKAVDEPPGRGVAAAARAPR